MTSSGHEKIASDVIANDQITHSKNSVWLMSENLLGRSKALFEESVSTTNPVNAGFLPAKDIRQR